MSTRNLFSLAQSARTASILAIALTVAAVVALSIGFSIRFNQVSTTVTLIEEGTVSWQFGNSPYITYNNVPYSIYELGGPRLQSYQILFDTPVTHFNDSQTYPINNWYQIWIPFSSALPATGILAQTYNSDFWFTGYWSTRNIANIQVISATGGVLYPISYYESGGLWFYIYFNAGTTADQFEIQFGNQIIYEVPIA